MVVLWDLMAGWWFGTFFFHILGIMIPTDELIFFRGVGIPSTREYIPWYSHIHHCQI